MAECTQNISHNILIYSRGETFNISGVQAVVSFDETIIVLHVCGCHLTVEGENFSIVDVDTDKGVFVGSGVINALYYSQASQHEKGLFSRLLGR